MSRAVLPGHLLCRSPISSKLPAFGSHFWAVQPSQDFKVGNHWIKSPAEREEAGMTRVQGAGGQSRSFSWSVLCSYGETDSALLATGLEPQSPWPRPALLLKVGSLGAPVAITFCSLASPQVPCLVTARPAALAPARTQARAGAVGSESHGTVRFCCAAVKLCHLCFLV